MNREKSRDLDPGLSPEKPSYCHCSGFKGAGDLT